MSGLATKTVAAGPLRRTSVPLLTSSTIRPPFAGICVAPVPCGAGGWARGGLSAGGGETTVPRGATGGACAPAVPRETASATKMTDPAMPESGKKRITNLETHFEVPV